MSHARAAAAQQKFQAEIVPIKTIVKDLKTKRSKAEELGLPIMAVFKNFAVAGVEPHIMGIGPAYAIPKVLDMADMSIDEIDLFEINEAFASQAVYCVKKLGL